MSQSLALVLVHIIFSTKNRMPFLQSAELRSEVHAYLTGTLRGLECDPLQVGGVEDHVHILCGLSRKISLAELVKNLKTSLTKSPNCRATQPSKRKTGPTARRCRSGRSMPLLCVFLRSPPPSHRGLDRRLGRRPR